MTELSTKEKAAEYDRLKERQRLAHKKRNELIKAKVKAFDAAVAAGILDPIDPDSIVVS